jgi:tetratricopeptide (TPR) repeat protein
MWIGGSERYPRAEITERSDQAVQAAIRNDPDYAYAYYVRGIFHFFRTLQFREGLEDFRHALELDPDNPVLVAAIGKGALLTGDFDRAIEQYQKALAMDPVFPEFHWFLGRAYKSDGRLDEAEATLRTLIRLSPDANGEDELWETLLLKDELEVALALADTSFKRAITYSVLGDLARSDEALAELVEGASPYSIALVHGYRGDVDETFQWLDRMLEDENYVPAFILTEPALRSVYADERWSQLMERLGLTEYWLAMAPAQNPGKD